MSDEADVRRQLYFREAIDLIARRAQVGREVFYTDVHIQDAVMWRLGT